MCMGVVQDPFRLHVHDVVLTELAPLCAYRRPCKISFRRLSYDRHNINKFYQRGEENNHSTFCLFVYDETPSHTSGIENYLLSMDWQESKESSRVPEIFIRSQQFSILPKYGETYPIGVCLQHLVPTPKHIAIHVIVDAVLPTKHEMFVWYNVIIPRWNCTGVYCLRVGTYEGEKDLLVKVPQSRRVCLMIQVECVEKREGQEQI